MIKEKLNKLKHLEYKEIYLLVIFIVLALVLILIKNIIKDTHAYYSNETGWIPIFNGKVGNFAKEDYDIEKYLQNVRGGLESRDSMNARGDTLRRFQGSSVKNYICFGTTNTSDCTKNTDRYMYRIIGIDTKTKELKIIKKDAFNHGNWHSANGDYKWNQSQIYTDINGSLFLNNTNYVPNDWKGLIVSHDWKYGDLEVTDAQTGKDVLSSEKSSLTSSIGAKVGLMYISDYYLAVSNDGKCYQASDSCKTTNWMWLWSNDTNSPTKDYEWFMQRRMSNQAWYVQASDRVGYSLALSFNLNIGIRPVMYLISDIYIKGSGTVTDPFIITKEKPEMNSRETDIEIIQYQQMSDNLNKYMISKYLPVTGYKVNSKVSGCSPAKGGEVTYSNYSISSDGTLSLTYTEVSKPTKVVCRIYFDLDKQSDVIIYAYLQDDSGDRTYNGKKYKIVNDVASAYTYIGKECESTTAKTTFTYDKTNGFTITSYGPDTCYAYFSK